MKFYHLLTILPIALAVMPFQGLAANIDLSLPHLRRVEDTNGEPGPLKVGDIYETRVAPTGESLVPPIISEGGTNAKYSIKIQENASYMALHFASCDLDDDCVMEVSGKNLNGKQQRYEMTGKGKRQMGTFWAQHVKGDQITVQVKCKKGPAKDKGRFVIDEIAVGYTTEEVGDGRRRASICGSNDAEEALCYKDSLEYKSGKAVAHLLISGGWLCTGWLVGENGLFLTNEHCISTEEDAQSTDFTFMYEEPACNEAVPDSRTYSGSDFIRDSPILDYALLQIWFDDSPNPSVEYGFLKTCEMDTVTVGETIYSIQHPGGFSKKIVTMDDTSGGTCTVDTFRPGCSSGAYEDVGYRMDTQGGSSGSPVLSRTDHKVIALHHCGGCNTRGWRVSGYNLGVPFWLIYPEIRDLLPQSGCSENKDCDDRDPCNGVETCTDGMCQAGTPVDCSGQFSLCGLEMICGLSGECVDDGTGEDGICDSDNGETVENCPNDCQSCGIYCANGEECCPPSRCHPRHGYCRN